jgi:hypothetical protein
VAVGLNSGGGLIRVARSGSSGCGCTHAPDRRRAAADGGERRRAAAVKRGIELGGSISCAESTRAMRERRQGRLGRHGRLRHYGDGARRGEAERRDGETPASAADDTARGDINKWHGWPPHLLARIRGSSSTAERRQRRRTATAAALGFRRDSAQARTTARARVGDPRGGGAA